MILTPKRKLQTGTPMDESVETIFEHTVETVINEIETSSRSFVNIASFENLCKLPVGTDKYPNPP